MQQPDKVVVGPIGPRIDLEDTLQRLHCARRFSQALLGKKADFERLRVARIRPESFVRGRDGCPQVPARKRVAAANDARMRCIGHGKSWCGGNGIDDARYGARFAHTCLVPQLRGVIH